MAFNLNLKAATTPIHMLNKETERTHLKSTNHLPKADATRTYIKPVRYSIYFKLLRAAVSWLVSKATTSIVETALSNMFLSSNYENYYYCIQGYDIVYEVLPYDRSYALITPRYLDTTKHFNYEFSSPQQGKAIAQSCCSCSCRCE